LAAGTEDETFSLNADVFDVVAEDERIESRGDEGEADGGRSNHVGLARSHQAGNVEFDCFSLAPMSICFASDVFSESRVEVVGIVMEFRAARLISDATAAASDVATRAAVTVVAIDCVVWDKTFDVAVVCGDSETNDDPTESLTAESDVDDVVVAGACDGDDSGGNDTGWLDVVCMSSILFVVAAVWLLFGFLSAAVPTVVLSEGGGPNKFRSLESSALLNGTGYTVIHDGFSQKVSLVMLL
jgi:hypothetical protein